MAALLPSFGQATPPALLPGLPSIVLACAWGRQLPTMPGALPREVAALARRETGCRVVRTRACAPACNACMLSVLPRFSLRPGRRSPWGCLGVVS